MQHGDEARPGAKMLGIGPDGQHGLRRSVEQQIVDNGLVLVGDIRDCPRQGEDLMEVLHRQQFSLAGASHSRAAAPWHFGQWRLEQLLYEMAMCPQALFSQRATWPPRAAVRQFSMALMTLNSPRLM